MRNILRGEIGSDCFHRRRIDITNDHIGSCPPEPKGDRAADATGTARDNRCLTLVVIAHC
jgi:hypothetical protein